MLHKSSGECRCHVQGGREIQCNRTADEIWLHRVVIRIRARVSLRNYVTDSIRITVAWCINFDQFVPHKAEEGFLRAKESDSYLPVRSSDGKPNARYSSSQDEKSPGLDFRCERKRKKEQFTWDRGRLPCLKKSAQGAFWISVLQRYYSIYTPVNRILQETAGVYTKN